jgi:hypothetical protein
MCVKVAFYNTIIPFGFSRVPFTASKTTFCIPGGAVSTVRTACANSKISYGYPGAGFFPLKGGLFGAWKEPFPAWREQLASQKKQIPTRRELFCILEGAFFSPEVTFCISEGAFSGSKRRIGYFELRGLFMSSKKIPWAVSKGGHLWNKRYHNRFSTVSMQHIGYLSILSILFRQPQGG